MAFCMKCGQELSNGAKFCANCGTAVNGENSNTERRTVYDGKIHKCPNCGELLEAFSSNCPSCGHEIRDTVSSYAIQNFADKLSKAELRQEKITIIRNFPIPNTKEDIYEFLILASSNIGNNLEEDISNAWQSKIEQAYQKAKIVFKDETELSHIQNIYNQVSAKLIRDKKFHGVKKAGTVVAELMPVLPNLITVFGWLISLFVLLPLCRPNLDNVGTNGCQLLLMIDLFAGAILIPFTFKCESALPKIITALGLILSIIVLIPLCSKNLDNVGTNAFQIILIVDIICSVMILVRMFQIKTTSNSKIALNGVSFIIALVCIVVMLVVYGIGSISATIKETNEKKAYEQKQNVKYKLSVSGLNQYLPEMPSEYGAIKTDNEARFSIELFKVSAEQFEDFVQKCKNNGFSVSTTKTDSIFYAYHEEELELDVFFDAEEQTLQLYLDAPLPMNEIRWPENNLVDLIPKPDSLTGNICWESSEHFGVYIANVTADKYDEYVDACMSKGFTKDYSRGEDIFHAYNKKGYYLVVEKHLFDKMYISIKVPEED